MGTYRQFAYNPTLAPISGTVQEGNLAIGASEQEYSSQPGGVIWWMGPDEDLGYVVAYEVPTQDRSTPIGPIGTVRFWRSSSKTENSFIELVQYLAGPGNIFVSGDSAKTWLNSNGCWTSYTSAVTSNLILYYDPSDTSSYPGTGNLLSDLSGNSLNGTISNLTFTNPYFGYNGVSSQVTIADNPLLEPGSGSWTTEAWFYVNSTPTSAVIMGKFDNGGSAQHVSYSIRINTSRSLFAQYSNGNFATFVNSTSYTVSLNNWYQVVYVWTNSGIVKTIETYINGVSIGSVNHTFTSILNSINPLYLGSYNGGEFSQWLNGRIGVTRIYNKALSSSEVLQNFNHDRSKYGL